MKTSRPQRKSWVGSICPSAVAHYVIPFINLFHIKQGENLEQNGIVIGWKTEVLVCGHLVKKTLLKVTEDRLKRSDLSSVIFSDTQNTNGQKIHNKQSLWHNGCFVRTIN